MLEFPRSKNSRDGHHVWCKSCANIAKRDWYLKNREDALNKKRKARALNPEAEKRARFKWCSKNRQKRNAKQREYYQQNKEKCLKSSYRCKLRRLAEDPLYKLRNQIGTLVGNSIRKQGYSKSSKTYQLIGIDYEKFLEHLKQTAINNYGSYDSTIRYHIDHIYPCSLAKDEAELLQLQYYTNLQFLKPEDNIQKSNKIESGQPRLVTLE